jgi:hypothetical protein
MSMRLRRVAVTGAGAALIAAGSLLAGSAAPASASIAVSRTGTGSTAAAAQAAATRIIRDIYVGCSLTLVSDVQLSSGLWSAVVAGECAGYS